MSLAPIAKGTGRGRLIRKLSRIDRAPLKALLAIFEIKHKDYDLKVQEQREWALKDAELKYREMMCRVHPDKGGSHADSAALNRAIERVRSIIRRGNQLRLPRVRKKVISKRRIYRKYCEYSICSKGFTTSTKNRRFCCPDHRWRNHIEKTQKLRSITAYGHQNQSQVNDAPAAGVQTGNHPAVPRVL